MPPAEIWGKETHECTCSDNMHVTDEFEISVQDSCGWCEILSSLMTLENKNNPLGSRPQKVQARAERGFPKNGRVSECSCQVPLKT